MQYGVQQLYVHLPVLKCACVQGAWMDVYVCVCVSMFII